MMTVIMRKVCPFLCWSMLILGFILAVLQVGAAPMPPRPGMSAEMPVSPSTGAFFHDIPLTVPAYRGLEPDLSLVYTSGAGNGFVGMGWNLSGQSFIERASPGQGAPNYRDGDIFLLDGEQLEVPCATFGGTHCTRHQDYRRIQRNTTSDEWYVWGKDGTKSAYRPVYRTDLGTFRWGLSTVQDTRGNTVNYHYWCDPAQNCYLDMIAYNNTTITLFRESRPDDISFTNGLSIGYTRSRLKTIAIKVGDNLARAYKLTYAVSRSTQRSLLSSVTEYGSDATLDASGTVTGGTALPAITISYQAGGWSFPDQSFNSSVGGWSANTRDSFADVNGDSKSDLVRIWQNGTSAFAQVNPSNGAGFPSQSFNSSIGGWNASTKDYFADVNGDGKSDLVRIWQNGTSAFAQVNPSNGKGFPSQSFNSSVGGWNASTKDYFADVNGDGRSDLVRIWQNGGNAFAQVNLSNGTGFPSQSFNSSVGGWNPAVEDHFSDVNGDGKSDLVRIYENTGSGNAFAQINLSNGKGFPEQIWNSSVGGWNPATIKNYFVDVNGDSRSDLVRIWQNGASAFAQVNLFNGFGFAEQSWNSSIGGWNTNIKDAFVDVNGDGKGDLVRIWPNGNSAFAQVNRSAGLPPDLLSAIKNAGGGMTTVEYSPSSAWANTYLPVGMIFQTVSSVTISDGRGVSGITTHSYSGALWSPDEREFLGFRYHKAVIDSQGSYQETYSRQTINSAGYPDAVSLRNSAGKIYYSTAYAYSENATAPFTSLLIRQQRDDCNLSERCRTIRTNFAYDEYANNTQIVEYGDEALAGDERMTARTYAPNTNAYIVGLPEVESVYSGTTALSNNLVKQTLYYYDDSTSAAAAPSVGNLTRTDAWNNQTGGYVTIRQQYDAYGNVTQVTDPRGATATTTYDPIYHLFPAQICDALNHCTTQAWDALHGALKLSADSNGATTSYAYDALGRKIGATDAAGNTTTWQYLSIGDPNQQHVRMARPDGSDDGLWSDTYTDGLGRTYRVVKEGPSSGLSYEQDTAYSDATERIRQRSLWRRSGDAPLWESYAYDGAGRLLLTTHPDGNSSTIQYAVDAAGKPYEIMRDELGHERASWTDAYGNASQVRERNGTEQYFTRYVYTPLNKLEQVVDQAGNTTTFAWDSLGRKVAMRDPDLGAWSYTYDAGGLLLTQTDAKNQTASFTYDALGRIKTRLSAGQTTSWFYDEEGYGASIGRLTHVTYPSGSERHNWNSLGLETSTTRCVDTACQTTSQTYDALQRPSTQMYPDGDVVSYAYDAAGNLHSVSGYVDAMTWSPSGQLTSLTYANGTTTSYMYDSKRLWLLTAAVNQGATTLYTAAYTYDAAGLVKTATDGAPTASTLSYAYDDLNRLTGVSGAQNQTFSYDALGNMTSNSLVGNYAYGDSAHKHAVTTAGSNTYAYDANGNMISGAGRTFGWDAQNRLISTTQGAATTSYAYDAGEQRIKKTQGANTTRYFSRLVEQVNGQLTQYYYAGSILVAKKDAGGTKTWYHADRLGSIRLMTDANGSEVKEYAYQAFGQTQSSSGAVSNERGYTGHITDGETGLIYMVARYYDAQLGRFLSADTSVSDWENPQDLNPYSYVVNNPISNTDPTGHAPRLAPPWMFEDEHWQVERQRRRSGNNINPIRRPQYKITPICCRADVATSIKAAIPRSPKNIIRQIPRRDPLPSIFQPPRCALATACSPIDRPIVRQWEEAIEWLIDTIDENGRRLDTNKAPDKGGISVHWWGVRLYLNSKSADQFGNDLKWFGYPLGLAGARADWVGAIPGGLLVWNGDRIKTTNEPKQGVVLSVPWTSLAPFTQLPFPFNPVFGDRSQ